MRSKHPVQPSRNSSQSTFSFFRNVLVGMVFFEPMPQEKLNDIIQRSETMHAESVRLHEKSQQAIEASNKLISEFSLKY